MTKLFENILEKDEVVEKVYKPNKLRLYLANAFAFFLIWLFIFGVMLLAVFVEDDEGVSLPVFTIYITLGVFGVTTIFNYIFLNLAYEKRLYAYTNKRILIQSGTIGIDYKSLDYKTIGATEVRVDLIDKLIKKNTGTIRFGSMSSPISASGSMFSFVGVDNPYEIYKEIKAYIDHVKEK